MSGNAHQRRIFRRNSQRIWDNAPAKFNAGDTVKITAECYGQRYFRSKAVVIGKGKSYGTCEVKSPRRVKSLLIQEGHLELVATATQVFEAQVATATQVFEAQVA